MATTTANSAHPVDGIPGNTLKTLVTVLSIAVVLIGAAAGYGELRQRLDDACMRVEKLEQKVEIIQASNIQTQVDLATIRTDLTTVKADLTYIRGLLERRQDAP